VVLDALLESGLVTVGRKKTADARARLVRERGRRSGEGRCALGPSCEIGQERGERRAWAEKKSMAWPAAWPTLRGNGMGALAWARSRPCGVGGGAGLRARIERGRGFVFSFLFLFISKPFQNKFENHFKISLTYLEH